MLPKLMSMLPSFLAYFGVAVVLLAVFLLVYVNVTPYDEISLIRQGNTAAAINLSGALFGFAMPVANVIAHSDALGDLAELVSLAQKAADRYETIIEFDTRGVVQHARRRMVED